MEVSSVSYQPAFGSNKIIRDADKICRIISKEFPAISGTKVETFPLAQSQDRFIRFYKRKQYENRAIRDDAWKLYKTSEPLDFYKRFVENMKKYKNINCADYTKLAELILAANGIKAVKAKIMTGHLKNLDHAVLIVNPSAKNFIAYKNQDLQKIIVIDPWLGFADYGSNAIVRYNSEFAQQLGLNDKFEKLVFASDHNPEISSKTVDYIREKFPQFLQKSGFMTFA